MDVYQQYFQASCVFQGVERRAVSVKLTATSGDGMISYEVSVSFFPHQDEEDFAVSGDAFASKTLYEAKGRRSGKREQEYLKELHTLSDSLAMSMGGVIDWDRPLREARFG